MVERLDEPGNSARIPRCGNRVNGLEADIGRSVIECLQQGEKGPRRRQPALSRLALGAGIAVLLSAGATVGLALYVSFSGSFGSVYGPLAGIFALLLWALLSSIALFYGTAVCAQLEALRAGDPHPAMADPGRPHARTVGEGHDH